MTEGRIEGRFEGRADGRVEVRPEGRRRWTLADRLTAIAMGPEVRSSRLLLRPLVAADFPEWQEVRRRCAAWLAPWEAQRRPGQADVVESRRAFEARCEATERERVNGSAYRFGIFAEGRFSGEINLGSIQRGAFQNVYIGYWIDQRCAGRGHMPEALVLALKFAFEELGLHRVQVSIIPRNASSRRVVEKLGLRDEGIAQKYLEINGVWEDHVRYAMTVDEWRERKSALLAEWTGELSR
jgi:[ribosomal protein S5]-alanine N-acetyltransferase